MNTLDFHSHRFEPTWDDLRRRKLVLNWCRAFIAELRALLRRVPSEKQRERCATCAFNPATDKMKGFDATCVNLRDAIDRGKPFYCHDDLPFVKGIGWVAKDDPSQMRPCGGYADIAGDPDAKSAVDRAIARCGGFDPS